MAPIRNKNHGDLTQIEYRSFLKPIQLYHYPHHLMAVSQLEEKLSATVPGFIRRLESTDTLCNEDGTEKNEVPDGDEVPIGFTEVAYLYNVFRDKKSTTSTGSALGFRLLDEDSIQWMCFDRPIGEFLSTAKTDEGVRLFDKVAELERGDNTRNWKGTVQGYPEHRHWYEGLSDASRPLLKLSIIEANRTRHDQIKSEIARRVAAGPTS
jgi:hypothetical protein